MRPNRLIGKTLHVYLFNLPVNADGNEMIAMLRRYQGKLFLPEKPWKVYPSSVSDPQL